MVTLVSDSVPLRGHHVLAQETKNRDHEKREMFHNVLVGLLFSTAAGPAPKQQCSAK
jgi:hypothetical protein